MATIRRTFLPLVILTACACLTGGTHQGPKEIIPSPLMGHSMSGEYGARMDKFIIEQAFGAAK